MSDDKRCTRCGSCRVTRPNGGFGACSFIGCKDPLFDYRAEAAAPLSAPCPSCGYTEEDAKVQGDHGLCKNAGNAPWEVKAEVASSPSPTPQYHELKTWPAYFAEILSGSKQFEVRKNDRDFKVGDVLILREYDPETKSYLGRETWQRVTYMVSGAWGIPADIAVMSIRPEVEDGEWVKVTPETMPERGENVLVCVNGDVEIDQLHRDSGTWLVFKDEFITHWMPLPSPPKENRNE